MGRALKRLPPEACRRIAIVDDDPLVRESTSMILHIAGYSPATFADGESFLETVGVAPGCVLLDIALPGRTGLEVLKEIVRRRYDAPVLMVSGHSETPLVVDAIKSGAFDFIKKPFDGNDLIEAVRRAIASWPLTRTAARPLSVDKSICARLTRREIAVLEHLIEGASNKETGRRLGISHRTVEIHRANIMQKLGAHNFAELMKIMLAQGKPPDDVFAR
jgi:FixJ family two-component response regulator